MNAIPRLACLLGVCSLTFVACGGSDDPLFEPPAGSGGNAGSSGLGGKAGQSGSSGMGGNNTGGSNTGGSNTGGSNTGGSNTGGSNTGGNNTGGSNTGGSGTGGSNTGGSNTGGSGGPSGCANGCNDSIACTVDSCAQGSCVHAAGDCPAGQYCDLSTGCLPAPICSSEAQCTAQWGNDPCKTNVHCDGATATCAFDVLDKDNDKHPPLVCGGDDCDDADAQRNPALPEICDGKDNDCDGTTDVNSPCPGLTVCEAGVCTCPAANQCGAECVDKTSNGNHCGVCFNACPPSINCENSSCACPGSEIACGPICVDGQTDPTHCGSCGNVCGQYSTCVSGSCQCTKTQCGAQCVDTQTDSNNCGACGNQCAIGTCQAGVCPTCLPGGMLIMIDQSGSMSDTVGTGTRLSALISAVTAFVQESASAGLSVGVTFYPRTNASLDPLCHTSDYATPTVPIAPLPGNAQAIVAGMTGKSADGLSVVSPPVEAAINTVRGWEVANPGRKAVVVLVNDGGFGVGCPADTSTWAVTATTTGYSGTPSVVTTIVGLGAPSATDTQTWNSMAAAGGGSVQNLGAQGSSAMLSALQTIRAGYVCP